MDEILVAQPRLEKRILPLLDVALTLMGMLIVMLIAAGPGDDPSQAVVVLDENGVLSVDGSGSVIGSDNSLDFEQLESLEASIGKMKSPQLTIHYPDPDSESNVKNVQLALDQLFAWCNERNIKPVPKSTKE